MQLSDSAKDNIIKLIVVNLYRTFLRKLLYTLLELLCFQGIDRVYPCEKLRREGRQGLEKELFLPVCQRVANLVVAAVINADDVPCNGGFYGFAVVCHQVCGLAQLHLLACAGKRDVHAAGKRAGTNAEKRQPVPMSRVHVRLYFENKAAEKPVCGFDFAIRCFSGTRRGRPFQKMLQKWRYAEVCQCRAEKDRRKPSFFHSLEVKRIARAVQKLHFAAKDIQICVRNNALQCIAEYTVCAQFYNAILLFI